MKLFFVVLLLCVVSCFCNTTTCSPDVDCSHANLLDHVVDPESCTRYYICVEIEGTYVASDSSFECPSSQYFDPEVRDCVDQGDYVCHNECSNHCDMECDFEVEGLLVAYPGDTRKYKICTTGSVASVSCPPEKPYFDGAECVSDPTAVCDFCSVHCPRGGIQVADPNNCRKFYICYESGNPNWELHASCNYGEYFSPTFGKCVEGATCSNICQTEDRNSTIPTIV